MTALSRFTDSAGDVVNVNRGLTNVLKRTAVVRKLKAEGGRRGFEFEEIKLTRHDAFRVGSVTRTLGRHNEIDDVTARKFFDQYADELGKGWWR